MGTVTFVGVRTLAGCEVYVCSGGRLLQPLCLPGKDESESQWCFEWGYGGAGPRLLAWSILAFVMQDEEAASVLAMRFKWAVIAQLSSSYWTLSSMTVEGWIVEQIGRSASPDDGVIELGEVPS